MFYFVFNLTRNSLLVFITCYLKYNINLNTIWVVIMKIILHLKGIGSRTDSPKKEAKAKKQTFL